MAVCNFLGAILLFEAEKGEMIAMLDGGNKQRQTESE